VITAKPVAVPKLKAVFGAAIVRGVSVSVIPHISL
jgi:hypothetical protein